MRKKCYVCEKVRKGDYIGKGIWVCQECQDDIPSKQEQYKDYVDSCARQQVDPDPQEFEIM